MNQTLLLNADLSPLRVIPWTHAVELLFEEKVYTVESVPGEYVRSQRLAIPWPSVIALKRYTQVRPRVKFSPRMVALRDGARCSYCGVQPRRVDGSLDLKELTLDHVVPRSQRADGQVYLPWSRKWVNVTCWENATTACRRCNSQKNDRTPAQAGMTLRAIPRIPTQGDVLRIMVSKLRMVPEVWMQYLPEATRALVASDEKISMVSAG